MSESQMDFWRQTDIVPSSELSREKVTVIGAGGIGSPTTLALAKMGISQIVIYDDDFVETHNLPNQMYRFGDLGSSKVEALAQICHEFAGVTPETKQERFSQQQLAGIVISGVDSMAARQVIWQKVKYNPSVKLYVEARMGAEVARIHTVKSCDPSLVRWYETTLYNDEDAKEEPCTAQAIIYNVFMIASLVSSQVAKFVRAEVLAREIIFDLKTLSLIIT